VKRAPCHNLCTQPIFNEKPATRTACSDSGLGCLKDITEREPAERKLGEQLERHAPTGVAPGKPPKLPELREALARLSQFETS
jgi:hypothetical protein